MGRGNDIKKEKITLLKLLKAILLSAKIDFNIS